MHNRIAELITWLGAVGCGVLATEDLLRFWFGALLLGATPSVIGMLSAVLLVAGGIASWRSKRAASWVAIALLVDLVGRLAVASHDTPVFMTVNIAHQLAPVCALAAGAITVVVSGPGVRRLLGAAACVATGAWLVGAWVAVPLELAVGARSTAIVLLLVVLTPVVPPRITAAMRWLWDSSEVR